MKKKQLNEAALEERIGFVLKTTFPTFKELKVKHQESFSIKFGHHNVTVDFKEPSDYPSRAIYDILLTTEDENTNLILLELKKEGKEISTDDIEQGISYARLIHPMPPITLISNGVDHYFYNTYSKSKIERDIIDCEFIKERIDSTFSLAINDFKQTVDILLNKNPQIISQIINDISISRFERLIGDISDITKPICEDFIIKREYIQELKQKCGENDLIGIIGPAFSGKTNILYDFFKTYHNKNNAIYYLDCKEDNYSIFQQLSNHLTKECRFSINKEKIREWIASSLNNLENVSFTFLLDNFDSQTSRGIKDEIIELVDLLRDSNHTIVFTIDLFNYEMIAKDKFRNYLTFFGSDTHVLKINELNMNEFKDSYDKLFVVSKSFFEPGAHFAIEYRQPRIQRLLAAYFAKEIKNLPKGQSFRIIAVPDYDLLQLIANNNSFSSALKELFRKLTIAFINDRDNNEDLMLKLASYYGGISFSSIQKVFKDDIQKLLESGFVNKQEMQNGLSIVYPKLPELIAYYGVEHITSILIQDYEDKSIEEIYESFEKFCMPFIYGDIVGTGVLLNIASLGYIDLFSNIVLYQKTLRPKKNKISDGTKFAMLINEKTRVDIQFKGKNFEEGLVGNFFPHLVLSQLAGYPLRLENYDKDKEFDFHLQLILDLATSPVSMVRISNFSINNIPPIESFEFKKTGTVISGRNGIIEPLVQSIQKCFYIIPEQIEKLYEFAFENKLFPVIWRIYLAIREETNSVNNIVANKSSAFLKKFHEEFPDLFAEVLNEESENNNVE